MSSYMNISDSFLVDTQSVCDVHVSGEGRMAGIYSYRYLPDVCNKITLSMSDPNKFDLMISEISPGKHVSDRCHVI